ncbi:hypothetical protein G6695_04915 [Polynucleobacter paneuropaeus]|nr:hypothetical protein [Polynucleobacter paneuropaeus]
MISSIVKNQQIVIFGHKLYSHTHSYIHQNFFNAFLSQGFRVLWIDENDETSNINFENSIFLTEGGVDEKIPLLKSCKYILHHCNTQKYVEAGCKFVQLRNYEYQYISNAIGIEKINNWTYWESESSTLFQPWGTNLLPHQIDDVVIHYNSNKRMVNYVGSIWPEVFTPIQGFADACAQHGIEFKNYCTSHVEFRENESLGSYHLRRALKRAKKSLGIAKEVFISDEIAQKLICESLISPDFRNAHHIKVGYVPCRTFKNLSYGALAGTNSALVNAFFEGLLPYSIDPTELFYLHIEQMKAGDFLEKMNYLKNFIRKNHTYINRAEQLIALL